MALRVSSQSLLAQARALRSHPLAAFSLARQYHSTPRLAAYKDDQDRESLKPRRAENTQSGNDDEVAAKKDAAFNPKKPPTPEAALASAADEKGNPLEASGANQAFSKPPKSETKSAEGKGKK